MFKLDETLQKDTFFIADLKICRVLLMNNANFPWLILVPKISNAVELLDLDFQTQCQVLQEINIVGEILQTTFKPYKLNIAMLGNVVRQLHIHVIARFQDDTAFPRPVWNEARVEYSQAEAQEIIAKIKSALK